MNILKTTALKKYYGSGANLVKAIDGIDFSVESGEFVAIVGTSGSGKSTLLHMLGGLDNPTSGSVEVDGKELSKMNDDQLTIFRRRNIGFVFQNYNLVPILNVYENIVLPIELDGEKPDEVFIDKIVKMLGLSHKACHHPCGRADRESGQQDQPGSDGASQDDGPAVPSDHRDDYP